MALLKDPKKIVSLIEASDKRLKPFRKIRTRMMQEFAGPYYGKETSRYPRPMNLIHQAVRAIVPNLIGRSIEYKIGSRSGAAAGHAFLLETALNQLVREIELRKQARMAAFDAMFGAGIIKTGMGPTGEEYFIDSYGMVETEYESLRFDAAQPYAVRVDLDDYILDPECRDREEAVAEGHLYRLPREHVVEKGLLSKEKAELLSEWCDRSRAMQSAADMSSPSRDGKQAIDWVTLADIWLPHEGVVITVPYESGIDPTSKDSDFILRTREYDGREGGEYHMLGFAHVSDNPMPVAPVSIFYDLHELANRMARKAGRQADRQKTVTAYEASAAEDAERIRDADDGEMIQVANVDAIKQIEFGGASEKLYEHIGFALQQFQQLTAAQEISGTGGDAETATEAEIRAASRSVITQDMRDQTMGFFAEIGRDLAYWLDTDPLIDMPLTVRKNGVDIRLRYSPEIREADFIEHEVTVTPHSVEHMDPQVKAKRVMDWTANVMLPMITAAAQTQGAFDPTGILRVTGSMLIPDEIDQVWPDETIQQIRQMALQMNQTPQAQPAGRGGGPGGAGQRNGVSAGRGGLTNQVRRVSTGGGQQYRGL